MMDFTRIIQRWEKQISVQQKTGQYIRGKWTEGISEVRHFRGTFLPMSDREIRYSEGGSYTTQDKKLYVKEKLKDMQGNELLLKKGDIIIDYDGEYEIDRELEAPEVVNYKKYMTKKKVVK
ncbi:hypothetical protein Amet_4357 [Alkaliphilus metalliredigens QYMF]|uniref:Uncharacterized protein n=1 Tax=Alkaliphilus metalliredigens (strain QYMF) TaxID=293826 RepID=A6TKD4_ALKMQ|nr:hypothetical protein [Alkaliphilus metalliredigens]ABR46652.1 hypothetical protein Amet_0424 [Alkaliphilus metalliredigens QYMF]ABR48124.1 hypothetical protein Amet_1961 [Alkaliphilus metalliredigens QYMF]ABR50431.1 hypothetical protein Amet_4357 [Alkaliphilus metalliredigens QYMF]